MSKLYPNGVGDETNIDSQYPDSGAHWDKIDESAVDLDETYIYSSSTDWQRDLYTIESITWTGEITNVEIYGALRGYAAQLDYKLVIKTHGTISEIQVYPSTGWSGVRADWATNPHTGQGWNWNEIENLQIGVSVKREHPTLPCKVTQLNADISYTSKEPGYIWTEADKLHYTDSRGQEKMILGTDTIVNAIAGHLFVEGTNLHYIDANGDERYQAGYVGGASGATGAHLWIEGNKLRYINSSDNESQMGTWVLGQSSLNVDTILED